MQGFAFRQSLLVRERSLLAALLLLGLLLG